MAADPNALGPSGSAQLRGQAAIAAFFDRFAQSEGRWRRRARTYHALVESIHRFLIPPDAKVLEIGCGSGDLLAAVKPAHGVGIDISAGMVELARERHPELRFEVAAGESYSAGETFDYIIASDLVPFADDLLALFEHANAHCHERSRVIVHTYSALWRPAIRLAELLRLKPYKPIRNWVSPADLRDLLELADFQVISESRRVLFPTRLPVISALVNGVLAQLWPFRHLCLTYWIVARPRRPLVDDLTVSVVVPCRNEQGMIQEIIERIPEMGAGTEIVFVEGGSKDDTRGEIERQMAAHPGRNISLYGQTGKGKGNAVRDGFAVATGDVLMILDGDLTVIPEDLPKFYRAVASGHGDFINGSRLVYDLEPGAMQFLNILGNRVFSLIFGFLMDQPVKDTLCGTKVLRREEYAAIARGRAYFGEFDPFGDFDLLLGAAKLSLKIVDMPVRYGARTYGTTNISRFRHGWLLLTMSVLGFYNLKIKPLRA